MFSEVHFYVDESFLYRNDAGIFGWYVPGDQKAWAKPTGSKHRWGIIQGIFDWYHNHGDYVPGGPNAPVKPPPRKRRRKDAPPDPEAPEGYTRKFQTFMETFKCWSCAGEGNMNTVKFMEWLNDACDFFQQHFDDEYTLVLHLDNASYHKTANPRYLNIDANNVTKEQLALWILENSPNHDDYSALQDENGQLKSKEELKRIIKNDCQNHPRKIVDLLKSKDARYRVEFTPPYWPHCVAPELMWNNLKCDYRSWDPEFKINQVSASVRKFMRSIEPKDCEGWVRHTDEFCFKVHDRDEETLKEYAIEM